ncbi:endonuclease/exonuclease/phosphatase family protein [Nocardioides sp. JQ2195]|uniref:endonuclease/exonuclease/phosphatase family protein n=1 Tax=Nocardioides sp. JQ2195 TaxID=2592334 RepID=UPI00143EAFAE|nr:endonuclease/exonuclease/phosphatase family protein [Nocardioides sp. JQ2195]QIX28456.1 endonuclease/exonuclease/phosphatase family protein [Nocardioides sp. JQ2195]
MSQLRALLLCTLLVLTASAVTASPTSAVAGTSDRMIQVIQHNTDALGPGPAMQAAADWGNVDAITFQELCKKHIVDLTNAGYNVHWSQMRDRGAHGCRKGNAIASTRAFGATKVYTLLTRGKDEQKRIFKLLCADLRGTGVARTTVCTSHFPLDYNGKAAPTGEQNRIKVANKIRGIVNAKITAGRRVVLTGDFNDNPKSRPLDRFYKANGDGRFWEGDQRCGKTRVCRDMAVTTDNQRKLDYFFASSPGVSKLKGMSKLAVPAYDPKGHYVIRGWVKFARLG